jgi:hypothetical protein
LIIESSANAVDLLGGSALIGVRVGRGPVVRGAARLRPAAFLNAVMNRMGYLCCNAYSSPARNPDSSAGNRNRCIRWFFRKRRLAKS